MFKMRNVLAVLFLTLVGLELIQAESPQNDSRESGSSTQQNMGPQFAVRMEGLLARLKSTSYQHTTEIDEGKGVVNCDCSGLVGFVLRQEFPEAYLSLQGKEASWRKRPLSVTFYETFVAACEDGTGTWKCVDKLMDVLPGDILAWRKKNLDADSTTGHTLMIAGKTMIQKLNTLAIFLCLVSNSLASDRPNVLLIMADDFRDYGGAFKKAVVKTPNLDRLRSRGTTFERAYVQYPVCNPSRCSMMSGLRAEQTGIVGNDIPLRENLPDIVTLPQLCKDAGWQSHAFGKLYHLGGGNDAEARRRWMDTEKSWDSAQTFRATATGQRILEGRDVTDGALKWCHWGAADGTDDDQPDGQIAAATVAMIEKLGDTPWFIGCGFMKPHDPFIAPKKYFDLYPVDSLKPWSDPADTIPVRKEHLSTGEYPKAFGKFTEQEWLELFRAYCAGTSFMDAQLGRVLDALDQHQLWDKTIVVFVGDHGYHTGERKWWNKNTLFERSCRAPLIIAAPGMKGGQTTRSLVEFVDLYPTIADYCGLKMPHTGAGSSMLPILRDPTVNTKDATFTLLTRSPKLHAQSIRTARWRFTLWSDSQTELYDHDTDPEELKDVSSHNADVVADLKARINTLPRFRAEQKQ